MTLSLLFFAELCESVIILLKLNKIEANCLFSSTKDFFYKNIFIFSFFWHGVFALL